MAKKHLNLYKDFRFRVALTVILVVLATLVFQNTLLLYPPFAMMDLPNFSAVFLNMLVTLMAVAVPVIAVLAFIVTRTLQPLHAAVAALTAGKDLDESAYFAARRSVASLWRNVFLPTSPGISWPGLSGSSLTLPRC